jgi:hypothetical protein
MLDVLALTAVLSLSSVPAQSPSTPPAAPAVATEKLPEDAVLLVLDAFNIVRMLDDKEYAARRDEVARNLIKNLAPFIVPAPPLKVPVTPAPKPNKPAVKPHPKPTAVKPPTPKPVKPKPAAVKPKTPAPPAGSSWAKVPQKARIAKKFKAAEAPFKVLRQKDPQQAAKVSELLRAARTSMAAKQFDDAEAEIDAALKLLGVPAPK